MHVQERQLYVITEKVKGTATCVLLYERMSRTADRHMPM